MPGWLDWALHSGFAGLAILAVHVLLKVNRRLDRDDSLKADYPPHRHIGTNGSSKIIYPKEYEPASTEKLI